MRNALVAITKWLTLGAVIIALSGCSWGKRDGIVFNEQQSVIMEPSLLARGVIVERPIVSIDNYATVATINMSKSQPEPVTVMYRLYWYDNKGLKVAETDDLQQLIPANSAVNVRAQSTSSLAHNVRIYVFLPQ